jgi:hypothetical protein
MNRVLFINPIELKPHEQIRFSRVLLVFAKIVLTGRFITPLLIDLETKTILDGHHRCWVAKMLRLKRIPCYCVNYIEEQSIRVHSRRSNILVNKDDVLRIATSGKVFPYKTTRHEYEIPTFVPVPLNQLWI